LKLASVRACSRPHSPARPSTLCARRSGVESLAESISLPVFASVGTDDHALLGQASSMIPILTDCKAGVVSRIGEW